MTLTSIIQAFLDALADALGLILSLLPRSPFVALNNYVMNNDILRYLNYLLPISQIIAITEVWLTAIGIFYIYQIILRWIKICSD